MIVGNPAEPLERQVGGRDDGGAHVPPVGQLAQLDAVGAQPRLESVLQRRERVARGAARQLHADDAPLVEQRVARDGGGAELLESQQTV